MATPFKREEIPMTSSRLKNLIKVYVTYGGYVPSPDDPGSLPQLSGLQLIGSVQKVTLKNSRQAQERRELNYDNFSKILEMVPGLESFDVSFEYLVLYKATFMEAVGFAGHELRNQTRPLLFALQLPSPTPDTMAPKTLLLRDCWLLDNPPEFDTTAKDDLRIMQSVPIACGGIEEILGA